MEKSPDLATQLADLRTRASRLWRRRVLAHRRLLSGVFAGLAVLLLIPALRPAPSAVVAEVPSSARFASAHPDLVVMPVRLPDAAMASLLSPGDRVDLIATDPQSGSTQTVAQGALVVELPPDADSGVTSGAGGRLVVVGVARGMVEDVATASVRDFLAYAYAH